VPRGDCKNGRRTSSGEGEKGSPTRVQLPLEGWSRERRKCPAKGKLEGKQNKSIENRVERKPLFAIRRGHRSMVGVAVANSRKGKDLEKV